MKRCVPINPIEKCYDCQRWWVVREPEERREAEECEDFEPFGEVNDEE